MVERFLKSLSLLALLLLLGGLAPVAGLAAAPQPAAPPAVSGDLEPVASTQAVPAGETASLALAIVKVVASLALVVGLMLLLAYLVKKVGLTGAAIRPGSLIRVLDSRMIAPKKSVAVLQIGQEYVVVGITDQNITLLSTLEGGADLEQLVEEQQTSRPPGLGSTFAALLHKAVNSGKKQEEK